LTDSLLCLHPATLEMLNPVLALLAAAAAVLAAQYLLDIIRNSDDTIRS
jgi:hypothetical protein